MFLLLYLCFCYNHLHLNILSSLDFFWFEKFKHYVNFDLSFAYRLIVCVCVFKFMCTFCFISSSFISSFFFFVAVVVGFAADFHKYQWLFRSVFVDVTLSSMEYLHSIFVAVFYLSVVTQLLTMCGQTVYTNLNVAEFVCILHLLSISYWIMRFISKYYFQYSIHMGWIEIISLRGYVGHEDCVYV